MQIIFQKINWKRRLIEQFHRFRLWLTNLKRWQAFVLILILALTTAFILHHYVYINRSWFLLEYDAPLEEIKPFVKLDDLIEISQLLSAAIELVQRGGQVVRQIYHQNTVTQLNQSIVTNADLQSNQEIVAGLKKVWPSLCVISEEQINSQTLTRKINSIQYPNLNRPELAQLSNQFLAVPKEFVTVWIDPLDATHEYIEHLHQFVTVMICVAIKGKPVIGVIHNPFTLKTTWAWIGRGRSGDLVSYAKLGKKSTPLDITVSRSHAGKVKAIVKKIFGKNVRITPAGGAGYKTLSIAKNIADLYIHSTKIKKWDICAGNAILRSLGGKMTSFSGYPIDYSQTNTPVHDGGIIASLPINEYDHEKFLSASGRLLDLI